MIKKIGLGLLIVLVIGQFFQPGRDVPETDPGQDFLTMTQAPAPFAEQIRTACYDCHSNDSQYPWYASISPVSWWLNQHIVEAREELNFSIWGSYPQKKKDHKLEECGEALVEGWMPLNSYTWMHGDADLPQEDRQRLAAWFNSLR